MTRRKENEINSSSNSIAFLPTVTNFRIGVKQQDLWEAQDLLNHSVPWPSICLVFCNIPKMSLVDLDQVSDMSNLGEAKV